MIASVFKQRGGIVPRHGLQQRRLGHGLPQQTFGLEREPLLPYKQNRIVDHIDGFVGVGSFQNGLPTEIFGFVVLQLHRAVQARFRDQFRKVDASQHQVRDLEEFVLHARRDHVQKFVLDVATAENEIVGRVMYLQKLTRRAKQGAKNRPIFDDAVGGGLEKGFVFAIFAIQFVG